MSNASDPFRNQDRPPGGVSAPARPGERRTRRLLPLARWWARRELRRTLDGLRVSGLESARVSAASAPTILAANHVSFWDLFVGLVLDEALGADCYALMDAENVCRLPLFRSLGGIPLRRRYPRDGFVSAARILRHAGSAVWIFPQGEPRPAHLRPLRFRRGIQLLARLAPHALIVPVGLQYAYANSRGPVSYASFGEPIPAGDVTSEGGLDTLERAVARQLERIDRCLAGRPEPFHSLVPSREWSSTSSWWIRFLDRITAPRGAQRTPEVENRRSDLSP
jgi:1-acyl-sn-glycerol-3-phosphate acyltransferase